MAFIVSLAGAWIPSFWGDEAASVMSAERPLPSLFAMLHNVDAVHGTYYVFLHFWIELFGASPLSVRFPSAVFVGIACSGTVVLANQLFSRRVAILAGVICVFLPRFTYMGSEARSYAISAAVAVWLTVLFVKMVAERETRTVHWLAYAMGLAVGIYVFLYLALLALVHGLYLFGLYLLGDRADSRLRRRWISAAAGGVALALPVVVFAIAERHQIAFLAHRSRITPQLILAGQWFGSVWFAAACWGFIALACAAAIVVHRRRPLLRSAIRPEDASPRSVALLLVWCLVPTTLLVAESILFVPLYTNRYLSFCAPAAAILVAVGVAVLPRFWMQLAAMAGLVALALPGYLAERSEFGKPGGSDWAAVSAIIGAQAKPGDAIVFDNSVKASWRPRVAMHVYPADYTAVDDIALRTPYERTSGLWDEVYPLQDVTARLVGISTVWSLETTLSDSDDANSDLHVLERAGFTVRQVFTVHRTIIYELVRTRS